MACVRSVVDIVIHVVSHSEIRDSLIPCRQAVDPESVIMRIMAIEAADDLISHIISLARVDAEHIVSLDTVVTIVSVVGRRAVPHLIGNGAETFGSHIAVSPDIGSGNRRTAGHFVQVLDAYAPRRT